MVYELPDSILIELHQNLGNDIFWHIFTSIAFSITDAVQNGLLKVTKWLINNSAKLTGEERIELLEIATEANYTELSKYLLTYEDNKFINDIDFLKQTLDIFKNIAHHDAIDVLKTILNIAEWKQKLCYCVEDVIEVFVCYDRAEMILLLNEVFEEYGVLDTALEHACDFKMVEDYYYPHLDLVTTLLENGANARLNCNELLRLAVMANSLIYVQLLTEYGADLRTCDNWCLNYAVGHKMIEMTACIIKHGDYKRHEWAVVLARNGYIDAIKILIE